MVEDQTVGLRLAFIGSIRDEILQAEELAAELIAFLTENYAGILRAKYEVDETAGKFEILREIAKNRHCLLKGSELDVDKAARLLLDDFRNGRLGRITLEFPESYKD